MGGSYVKAPQKRRYAITELGTASANTFASLSTSTGAAAGTSGFNTSSVYPGINTSGMVTIPIINTEQQTCYKAKGCPSGYFEEKPDDTYFNYTTSEGCYKVTGCKSPYLSSYENAEEVANYEPQDYHCYLPIYYIDVTYDLNLSSRNAEVRCQLSDGYKGAVFEITGKYEGKHINGTIRCDSTVQNVNSSWVIEGNEHITDMFEAARYEFSQGSGHMGGCVDFKKENGYFCEGNNYTFWKLRIRREMWSSDGDCPEYKCPDGYFLSSEMPEGYTIDSSKSRYRVCSLDPSMEEPSYTIPGMAVIVGGDSRKKCYLKRAKTCEDYGLVSAKPANASCTSETKKLGNTNGTCYSCFFDKVKVNLTIAGTGVAGCWETNGGNLEWPSNWTSLPYGMCPVFGWGKGDVCLASQEYKRTLTATITKGEKKTITFTWETRDYLKKPSDSKCNHHECAERSDKLTKTITIDGSIPEVGVSFIAQPCKKNSNSSGGGGNFEDLKPGQSTIN